MASDSLRNIQENPAAFYALSHLSKIAHPQENEEVRVSHVSISPRQFAHRLVPAYLQDTLIVGIDSLQSSQHWIKILSLWIDGAALYLPLKIKKEDLIYLREILQEYASTLQRYNVTASSGCQQAAETTLQEIQTGIRSRKAYYTPMGYTAGVNNLGHALPLKMRTQGKQIEALILNLGDGLQMHPLVDWSASVERYHFQSFPVLIDPKTLFAEKGVAAFTYLVRLQVEQCQAQVRGYSAEDVYGVIYSLGTIQSSFDSKIADRNSKPQLGGICGDMAIVLVIRDALIDLGYSKEEIQRLFFLEKLCNILFFYRDLREGIGDLDLWTLLKYGQQELSIRSLKVSEAVLSETELEFVHALLKPIAEEAYRQIQQLQKISLPPLPFQLAQDPQDCSFNKLVQVIPETHYVNFKRGADVRQTGIHTPDVHIPPLIAPTPQNAAATLRSWATTTMTIVDKGETVNAYQFVYRAFSTLEIPDPLNPDFWDQVPPEDLDEIIRSLTRLAAASSTLKTGERLIYPQISIWLTGYAIVDKLVRKQHDQYLAGFASPFYPGRFHLLYHSILTEALGSTELLEHRGCFEFQWLPMGQFNVQWSKIRHYFETIQSRCSHTLFALGSTLIDVEQGVKDLRKRNHLFTPWTPVQEHLKFLEPFLELLDQKSTSLEEQFTTLWMNQDNRYLPEGIEMLYFFAHYAWFACQYQFTCITKMHVPREKMSDLKIEIATPLPTHLFSAQADLGRTLSSFTRGFLEERMLLSENATQCLEGVTKLSSLWSTSRYREWMRIFSNSKLQITSTLQWMRGNISLLSEEGVQEVIEISLFQPGLLSRKIHEEPAILDQFRQLIQYGLDHFSDSHHDFETHFFLIRLGICIETFASKPSMEVLKAYETFLLEWSKRTPHLYTLYCHLLFLYQLGLPRGQDSLRELIKAHFWLSYDEPSDIEPPDWLLVEIASPLQSYSVEIASALEDAEWQEKTFSEIFHLLLPAAPSPPEPCSASYPLLMKGEYSLHIEERTFYRSTFQLIYLNKDVRKTLPTMQHQALVWGVDGIYYSQDGLSKIETLRSGFATSARRFPQLKVCGDNWFFKVQPKVEYLKDHHRLTQSQSFDFWIHSDVIILCKKKEYRPFCIIDSNGTDCRIFKVQPDGTHTLQMGNIWREDRSLARWFQRLGALNEACVWVNPQTGIIEEFELLELEIRFKREEGHFRCVTYPEFYLAQNQSLDILDHFKGAIVLENSTRTCVLLPKRRLRPLDKNFTTQVSTEEVCLEGYFSAQEKMYLYQVDPIAGTLVQPDPAANLYLTLLFAMRRNYAKALHYLNRTRPFFHMSPYGKRIEAIYDLKDQSPEALAFYLRFALHLIHNSRQVLLSEYGSDATTSRDHLNGEFYKWTAKQFSHYLRVHSIKEVSRIPGYIRLNPEEELFLLQSLQKQPAHIDRRALSSLMSKIPAILHLIEAALKAASPKPFWQPIFDIRQTMLHSGSWSSYITPQIYPLFPPDLFFLFGHDFSQINTKFCTLTPSSAPAPYQPLVRYTIDDLRLHFITLYERARQGKAELDIFFLMRSGEMGSITFALYTLTLRYVQMYPNEFKGLDFGLDTAVNEKTFVEIVRIANRTLAKLYQEASLMSAIAGSHLVLFKYQKSVSLTLHSPPTLQPLIWRFNPGDIEILKKMHHEMDKHFGTYLDLVPEALFKADTPFAFAGLNLVRETPTTQAMVTRMQKGYAQLLKPEFGKAIYRLKKGQTTAACLKEAVSLLEQKQQRAAEIKREAEKLANSYPEIAHRLGLRRMGRDLPEITMEGILTQCYLMLNPMLIRKANPSLNSQQIYQLIIKTIQYHLLQIQTHQLVRAIDALRKSGSIQHFAESIATHGELDPTAEPEIILYQSRTSKILRKQQADLLAWEIQTTSPATQQVKERVRLFAAPAGEGKTTLYIPIAMKRLQRLGYTPFSASSKALYCADREGLKETSQHVFAFEIDVLELALSTQATAADFQRVYEQLTQPLVKKGYKITPDVYFALDLKYQLALDQENVEEVRWLRRILAYCSSHVPILVDECRQNCSPFTQAKIGMGKPIPLPAIDRKTILQIYRILMSSTVRTAEGSTLQETVRLLENQQATMNEHERSLVKAAVLKHLAEETTWLKTESESDKERALELITIYFEEFFNTAMNLVWRMHHVHSIKANEDVHVPARTRQATRSYFDEVYLTLIATIQGTIQEGLTRTQASTLFEALERVHAEEVGSSVRLSPIEASLRKWVGRDDLRLNQFSLARNSTMEAFHRIMQRNPEVIFWFLENVILKQVQYSPEQISVNPVHFLHAFKHVTLFSADPGPEEIYGIYKSGGHVRHDPQFIAHAVHQFLTPENSQFMIFPFLAKARGFFDALLAQDPTVYSHLRMVCDTGGMLRNFTVEEIVNDFFQFLEKHPQIHLDGLMMFEESSNKEVETRLFLWMKDSQNCHELMGHDIPAALRSLGYNWEKLNLLTIIDPSHRAGANIEQPIGSSVLALLGEGLMLSDDIQGKLRGRGILKKEQRIIWGVTEKLAPKIATPITPRSTLEWEMRNESDVIDKEVILSAFQQIDYWIEEPARKALLAEEDPHKQIAIRKRYRKGFVKQADVDPIRRFKGKRSHERTETILWEYARQKYGDFQYHPPLEKAGSLCDKLSVIISAAQRRQSHLTTSATIDSRRQNSVYTFQREEMKKEYTTSSHVDLVPEASLPLPAKMTITSPTFVIELIQLSRTAQEVFGSRYLTEGLYFTQNALHTAKTGKTSLNETYLKPPQYTLIVEERKRWFAFALSDTEADFFQQQLIEKEATGCHLALLAADGSVAQNARGASQFTEALLKGRFVQDVVIDVGLAHCVLFHPMRFIERIGQWDDFWGMWLKMKKWQPLPHLTQTQSVEKHVPERIKKLVEIQPSSSSGFLSVLKNTFFG